MKSMIYRKKLLVISLFFVSYLLSGCNINMQSGAVKTSSPDFSQSAQPSGTVSPGKSPDTYQSAMQSSKGITDLNALGKVITCDELNIQNICGSYFYWSPSGDYSVFIGSAKAEGKVKPCVFLLRLEDKKVTRIIEGTVGKNYVLQEPQWSDDESMLTVPFYELEDKEYPVLLYDIKQGNLEVLPFTGMTPSISPDKSKVAYACEDGAIRIFDLSSGQVTVFPDSIKGYHPRWFSDSERILFFRLTGKNPFKLEGAELQDICILDTKSPDNIKSFGYEKVYGSFKWLIRDELAWIESGWDDGHYAELLDLNSFKLTELGDASGNSYQINDKQIYLSQYDYLSSFNLFNRNMEPIGVFTSEKYDQLWHNRVLSLVPDGRLIYMEINQSENKNKIMLSFLNGRKFEQLAVFEGLYYPVTSQDGAKTALVDTDENYFIIIEPKSLLGLQ
jgi:WD40 repeat protein